MKIKKALILSLLALGAVGVSACGKDEDENKTPSTDTGNNGDNNNDDNTPVVDEVAEKKADAMIEIDSYVAGLLDGADLSAVSSLSSVVTAEKAKINGKTTVADVTSAVSAAKTAILAEVDKSIVSIKKSAAANAVEDYADELLELAGLEAYASLSSVVSAEKAKVESKDSIAAIESALSAAKTAILAEFNNTKDLRNAIKNAKVELEEYVNVKKYVSKLASDSTYFDEVVNETIATIEAATSKGSITKALKEVKDKIYDMCIVNEYNNIETAIEDAIAEVGSYATTALTAANVTDDGTVAAQVTAYTESISEASFSKEATLLLNAAKIDIDFAVANLVSASLAPNREAAVAAYEEYITTNMGTKVDDGTVLAKVSALKAELISYDSADAITAAVEAGKTAIQATIDAIMTAEQVEAYKTTKKTALVAYATSLQYTDAIPGYTDNMAIMTGWIDDAATKLAIDMAFNDAKKAIYDGTEDYIDNQQSVVYNDIATVDDFLQMQTDLAAIAENEEMTEDEKAAALSVNYRLVADLDFTNIVTTEGSNIQNFAGTFDGNGYAIKNYNVVDATNNKRGLLFRSTNNATIKNLTLINCSYVGDQEGIALITGEATTTTFKNLEFNSCTVDAGSKSYAGLLIGRKTALGVTVDGITIKGNSYTSANYGGGLCGDARDLGNDAQVVFKNLNVDMTMNVTGNTGGFLIGRTDTDKFVATVENARININITGNSQKASALFDGASAGATYTYKNVIISGSMGEKVTSDIVVGQGKITPTMENVYVVTDAFVSGKYNTNPDVKTVESAEVTETFMTTLGFGDAWVYEDGKARLQYASTNVIPSDAVVTSLSVNTTLAKTRYKIGEAFNPNGITVTATYTLSNGTTMDRVLESYEYTVACPDYNNKAAGSYDVAISYADAETSYEISVVQIEYIQVVTNEATQVFTSIENFNTDGLIVKAQYSDGTEEKLSDDNYEVILLDVTSGKGANQVSILTGENGVTYGDYYMIDIVGEMDLEAIDSKLEVYVDSFASTSTVEDGYALFKSIKDALDYIESLGLSSEVEKVVNIAAGYYEEKVVVNEDNVTFVGEVDEDGNPMSVVTYGMASGHKTFNLQGTWGTDKSASALIYGTSFSATNIYFENSFDYFNDKSAGSDTQALAIGVYADQATFNNCSFTGYQDTVQVKNGRAYFYDCYIAGCVDYIFGVNCTAYFKNCEIMSLDRKVTNGNNGYVVAPKTDEAYTYGFYFDGCNFTAEESLGAGTMALARPWGADGTCVIMNSTISAAYSTAAYGNADKVQPRYADMSGNKPTNANFKEFNNTGAGAISTAVDGMTIMDITEAAKVTLTNLFAAGEGTGVTYTAWDAKADLDALLG